MMQPPTPVDGGVTQAVVEAHRSLDAGTSIHPVGAVEGAGSGVSSVTQTWLRRTTAWMLAPAYILWEQCYRRQQPVAQIVWMQLARQGDTEAPVRGPLYRSLDAVPSIHPVVAVLRETTGCSDLLSLCTELCRGPCCDAQL
jgi:hypothetical protein